MINHILIWDKNNTRTYNKKKLNNMMIYNQKTTITIISDLILFIEYRVYKE